jgi:hypothetical protein
MDARGRTALPIVILPDLRPDAPTEPLNEIAELFDNVEDGTFEDDAARRRLETLFGVFNVFPVDGRFSGVCNEAFGLKDCVEARKSIGIT